MSDQDGQRRQVGRRLMHKRLRRALGVVLAVSACGAPASEPDTGWFVALSSAYRESGVKVEKDGATTSVACFDAAEGPRCEKLAFVARDDFRRVRRYTPPASKLSQYTAPSYLRSDVVVPNCELPLYVLRPYYSSTRGWLFMHGVAVLLDGAVVYERAFGPGDVHLDAEGRRVEEYTAFVADDRALEAMRKIAKGGKLSIRFMGKKGHATVLKEHADQFGRDVADALAIYDTLTDATSPDLREACQVGR